MLSDLWKTNLRYGMNNFPENDTIRSWLPWKSKRLRTSILLEKEYKGDGSQKSPFIIDWLDNDPENPMKWNTFYKWFLSMIVNIATLAVVFCSAAYTGPFNELRNQFHVADEVITLGLSLYVLGFALGPLFWAPLSEVLGRRLLFIITYAALTAFNAGAAGSQNIWTLIILRFFAGSFGASPLTNAAGVIADLFQPSERGVGITIFTGAAFLGPTLGPMIGGFVGENVGWRWVEGVMTIFTGVIWIVICFFLPETYSPVLLHKRAKELSRGTGKMSIH
jgi:multidrug resistance protein